MPYIVLSIGVLIGLFAIAVFFARASVAQIKTFIQIFLLILYTLTLLFFAISGRIQISLVLLVLGAPFLISYLKSKRTQKEQGVDKNNKE